MEEKEYITIGYNKEILVKQILRDFTKFLKENKAYLRYKTNLATYYYPKSKSKKQFWYDVFTNGIFFKLRWRGMHFSSDYLTWLEFLATSFPWARTLEGGAFWRKLDSKWRDFFRTKYEAILK